MTMNKRKWLGSGFFSRSAVTKLQVVIISAVVIIAAIAGGAYYVLTLPKSALTIKIGIISSLTGAEAWIGIAGLNGAKMAVDEINAAGGVKGTPVELISYDDAADAGQAVTLASRLITDDKVAGGILNDGSELALPASRTFTNGKVAALVPWAGDPDIVKGGYVFRLEQSAVATAKGMAYYVNQTVGPKKIAAVVPADPYEESLWTAFNDTYVKLGGQVIYTKSVEFGEKEYTSIVTEIKALNPDVVYGPNDITMEIALTVQARGVGIMAPLVFAGQCYDPNYLNGTKGAAELGGGIITQSYVNPTDSLVLDFDSKYEARYGEPPVNFASYQTYDGVKIIAQAAANVGNDQSKVAAYISNLKDFTGPSGTISQFVQGECLKSLPIIIIKNNAFVVAAIITDPTYTSPF